MVTNSVFCAIGLMSGTSMDGVDAAIIYTDGESVQKFGPTYSLAYPQEFRKKISDCLKLAPSVKDRRNPPDEIIDVEKTLTDYHYQAICSLLKQSTIQAQDIDIVGFHGQTIIHKPKEGWSWQIGDGVHLSNLCGIDVVTDFRSSDLNNGGQGAPLTPLYNLALFRNLTDLQTFASINLGGVANITWINSSKGRGKEDILAFDTGPANALMDDWAELHTGIPYDIGGKLAKKGNVNKIALEELLSNPYFDKLPPKSLDRNSFSLEPVMHLSPEDGAATLLEFTLQSILLAVKQVPQPPEAWYVCGGGRHNDYLMERFKTLSAVPVEKVEKLGWRGDALEAEAFAFLAVRSVLGMPLSLPSTTGVLSPCLGGVLHKKRG